MWLIVALASLVALFLLVLSVPLYLAFRLDVYGKPKFSLRLVWLFGLVCKEIGRKKKAKPKKAKPKKAKEKKGGARKALKILRTKGLLRQLKTLVTDVLSRLKIRHLRADFRVGLDNPADTGLLFAVIGPALLFRGPPTYHLRVQPSFEGEAVLEGYAQGAVRLLPVRLVVPLFRFVFSLAFLRAIRTAVLTKWKRK